jgi:hypothetical protein
MTTTTRDGVFVLCVMATCFVMGFTTCYILHDPSVGATECCAQFDVPLNTQLEMETAQFEREVFGRTSQSPYSEPWSNPWQNSPVWSNPCNR